MKMSDAFCDCGYDVLLITNAKLASTTQSEEVNDVDVYEYYGVKRMQITLAL